MEYKVVPLKQSKQVVSDLESIIKTETDAGWEYVNHQYSDYLKPGNNGCFGLGAQPNEIHHIGLVVFKK